MNPYERFDNKISDERLAERFAEFNGEDDTWGGSVIKFKNSNKN